jgi:large subunit ribosomal protein L22
VTRCYADEARTLKRFRPRARGRANQILKRSSHVTVVVSEREA